MTSFEVGTIEQLTAAVDSMSNEQLTEAVRQQEGGADRILDQVFEGMRQAFDPAKAAGQAAVVQYEIAAPDGPRQFLMRVAGSPSGSAWPTSSAWSPAGSTGCRRS
jgi:hypothetical protein